MWKQVHGRACWRKNKRPASASSSIVRSESFVARETSALIPVACYLVSIVWAKTEKKGRKEASLSRKQISVLQSGRKWKSVYLKMQTGSAKSNRTLPRSNWVACFRRPLDLPDSEESPFLLPEFPGLSHRVRSSSQAPSRDWLLADLFNPFGPNSFCHWEKISGYFTRYFVPIEIFSVVIFFNYFPVLPGKCVHIRVHQVSRDTNRGIIFYISFIKIWHNKCNRLTKIIQKYLWINN